MTVASDAEGIHQIKRCESDGWVDRMGSGIGLYWQDYMTRELWEKRFETAQSAIAHACQMFRTSIRSVKTTSRVIMPLRPLPNW